MNLKKYMQINMESDTTTIDDITEIPMEDQIEAEEAESEYKEVIAEVEEAEETGDAAEELSEEIDTKVKEGNAIVKVAEAQKAGVEPEPDVVPVTADGEGEGDSAGDDGKAEEGEGEGDVTEEVEVDPTAVTADDIEAAKDVVKDGEIPTEEVVAVQEQLNTYYRLTKTERPSQFSVNKEDIALDTLQAYKTNLEGLKEIGKQIKTVGQNVWAEIVKAYQWVIDNIMKILPTKANRAKKMIADIKDGKSDITIPGAKQLEKFKDKYVAVSYIYANNGAEALYSSFYSGAKGIKEGMTKLLAAADKPHDEKNIAELEKYMLDAVTMSGQAGKLFPSDYKSVITGLDSKLPSGLIGVSYSKDKFKYKVRQNFKTFKFEQTVKTEYKDINGSVVTLGLNAFLTNIDKTSKSIKDVKEMINKVSEIAGKEVKDNGGSGASAFIMKVTTKMVYRSASNAILKAYNSINTRTYSYLMNIGGLIITESKASNEKSTDAK